MQNENENESEISIQSFIELGKHIYTRDIALSNYQVEKVQFEKQLTKLNNELIMLDDDIQEINLILTQLQSKQLKNSFYNRPEVLLIKKSITYNSHLLSQKLVEKQMCIEMVSIVNESIEELGTYLSNHMFDQSHV